MQRLIALAVMLLAVAACSTSSQIDIADRAVPRFHAMFNGGQFDALWYQASTELQKVSPQAEFVALLQAVQRKLGKVKSSEKQAWNVTYTTKTVVTLHHKTRFEEGDAVEQFVFRIDGENATLLGFNIQSNALALK